MGISTREIGSSKVRTKRSTEGVAGVAGACTPNVVPVDHVEVPANTFNLLRADINQLRTSVESCSDKVSDFERQLDNLNKLITTVARVEEENASMNEEIKVLSSKISNMEIQNVVETRQENLVTILQKIGDNISSPVDLNTIDSIARVPTVDKEKPKNIIVRFCSKLRRDEFLSAFKTQRMKNTDSRQGLTIVDSSENLYINEHLTSANKILHTEFPLLAKQRNHRFVCTQDGNKLLRKDDTSKIIHVTQKIDLSKL
ncbi:hypothetical protein HHI36_008420 [Cryptolaemus montrouzieri]|uniref:FP protein C-terminal domain-containing protein n=1 Tax=Cryptolaemus montrouzieri TaxID=559131 RepID=A0ABD2MSM7_9CUCU